MPSFSVVEAFDVIKTSTRTSSRVRFGYIVRAYRCLTLDLFIEKRSFNFADAVDPNLYTKSKSKSKRIGGEISCRFDKP